MEKVHFSLLTVKYSREDGGMVRNMDKDNSNLEIKS